MTDLEALTAKNDALESEMMFGRYKERIKLLEETINQLGAIYISEMPGSREVPDFWVAATSIAANLGNDDQCIKILREEASRVEHELITRKMHEQAREIMSKRPKRFNINNREAIKGKLNR